MLVIIYGCEVVTYMRSLRPLRHMRVLVCFTSPISIWETLTPGRLGLMLPIPHVLMELRYGPEGIEL